MSNKDSRILNQQSGRYPFRVSEEYFDNLAARIMEQIPEEETSAHVVDINRKRRSYRWISIASIAASFILVAVVALKLIPMSTSKVKTEEPPVAMEYTEDDYNEDLMKYTMADGMMVYGYLSGEDEE